MNTDNPFQPFWQALQTGIVPPTLQLQAQVLIGSVAVLWVLELIDTLLLRGAFNSFGIRPRQMKGLRGILLAPLLHGNLKHLAANTIPFIVLGWLVMLRSLNDFLIVTAVVWLASGIGVWLFASSRSNHIGASGIVFGYFGFLVSRGYFEQSFWAIAISVLVGLIYGSLIWGVLPIRRGVSWLGHLCGFGGGILVARYLSELQHWVINITS